MFLSTYWIYGRKKRGNLEGRPQSKTLINKYGIYEYVCLFVCAGGRSNPCPPQKSHPPPKTDWCRALQLTPRAPSINQLPELSMQEMMFWKLAPSAARGGRGWFDMGYSENKEKQVSGNHVYSLRHRGEGKKLIFLTFWGFHFNRSPLWLQWKHPSYSPLSRHYESLSMHQRSIQANHHSIHNHARLLRLRETLICSHGPSRVIFQEKALLLYLFMFRLQICVCVCILKYTVHTLCVRSLQVQPIRLILFTSPLAVQYFKYTFHDFKAYPRRRTRPLPRRSSTHDRTKGGPPILDSLSEYVKCSSGLNSEKLPELSGPLAGLPCGQTGPRLCLVRPPALASVAGRRGHTAAECECGVALWTYYASFLMEKLFK